MADPRLGPARTTWIVVLLAVGGTLLGFAIGASVYVTLNPFLEASDGPLREFQGLLWNVVPALTVGGGVLGGLLGARRR